MRRAQFLDRLTGNKVDAVIRVLPDKTSAFFSCDQCGFSGTIELLLLDDCVMSYCPTCKLPINIHGLAHILRAAGMRPFGDEVEEAMKNL